LTTAVCFTSLAGLRRTQTTPVTPERTPAHDTGVQTNRTQASRQPDASDFPAHDTAAHSVHVRVETRDRPRRIQTTPGYAGPKVP
jgi:hypothetical protein